MIFEYTSIINIAECDMDEICDDVKDGRDFADAFEDVMSGYDSCDYYHMGDIYESVEKEIKRRIKKSEREETKMPIVTKEMTNEELIALRKEVNKILADREKEKVDKAIENFRKAFEEVKEVTYEIRVGEEWRDNCYYIEHFDEFHFEY
jgi:hypothetical protein